MQYVSNIQYFLQNNNLVLKLMNYSVALMYILKSRAEVLGKVSILATTYFKKLKNIKAEFYYFIFVKGPFKNYISQLLQILDQCLKIKKQNYIWYHYKVCLASSQLNPAQKPLLHSISQIQLYMNMYPFLLILVISSTVVGVTSRSLYRYHEPVSYLKKGHILMNYF